MQSEVLSGWKEIANRLGKRVHTVQRYERELGLPVRRAGKTRGSVFAVKSELDAWVASRQSVLSRSASLKNRMDEMRDIADHTKKLILEIRASARRFAKRPNGFTLKKVKSGTGRR